MGAFKIILTFIITSGTAILGIAGADDSLEYMRGMTAGLIAAEMIYFISLL